MTTFKIVFTFDVFLVLKPYAGFDINFLTNLSIQALVPYLFY
jgi:hypothetical protein